MRRDYLPFVACCVLFGAGVVIGLKATTPAPISAPKEARAPEYVPDQPPGSTCLLVAVTPDGTKIYRVESPQTIVPFIVAISPSGQIGFR